MAFLEKELSTSKKQAVIKLIEKKDRDKRFIKSWKPISLLSVKLISKVLSNWITNLLPSFISSNQNAYITNRFISEEGRLLSDILEMTNILIMEGSSFNNKYWESLEESWKNPLRWIETFRNSV